MSNPHNTAPATEIVSHNVYFEGKVQSLGMETPTGKATVGIMKRGNYTFSASSPETMMVISGRMQVQFPGKDDQQHYEAQGSFEVPAGSSFEVHCEADVAYICYYA